MCNLSPFCSPEEFMTSWSVCYSTMEHQLSSSPRLKSTLPASSSSPVSSRYKSTNPTGTAEEGRGKIKVRKACYGVQKTNVLVYVCMLAGQYKKICSRHYNCTKLLHLLEKTFTSAMRYYFVLKSFALLSWQTFLPFSI